MFDSGELQQLIRTAKRGPLVPTGAGVSVSLGVGSLEGVLPHRAPMLLVDGIDAIDLASGSVRGRRVLRSGDTGFAGHFPGEPIYPGVLIVEAMGQLAITLLHFVGQQRLDVPADTKPGRARATHIHHATFIASFQPGDTMTLHARVVHNDYTLVALMQAWKGDTLAAFAICEVLVDE